ncbi:MAG: hypothetical protein NT149_02490 [Candidatus Gottesmanbacteria bacterium]|nr:hypothetical protein [Candidatus Gottesmanbacteria bacterium]
MSAELLRINREIESNTTECATDIRFSNNVTLTIVGVKHTSDFFMANEPALSQTIKNAAFVGVESDASLLDPKSAHPSDFYTQVILKAWDNNKPVICCDPLPQDTKGTAYFTDVITGFVGTDMSAILALDLLIQLKSKRLTRRDFLKVGGVFIGALLFSASGWGRTLSYLTNGCENSTSPQATDSISYSEFRNATTLLGYDLLAKNGMLSNLHGVEFIGKAHIANMKGYVINGQLDTERAKHVFKNNLYYLLFTAENLTPMARVWLPDPTHDSYTSIARIPITGQD